MFQDGDETIEFIKEHEVDVIFTDVKMSNVTGIELSKYVYDNNLNIKLVIVSGYTDFNYAQEAMKYGGDVLSFKGYKRR